MIKNIEEVKKILDDAKANSLYDNFPLSKEEQAIEYLLSLVKKQSEAIKEFTDKHFHGGSKANREDYIALGIPTADIYKLREALKEE